MAGRRRRSGAFWAFLEVLGRGGRRWICVLEEVRFEGLNSLHACTASARRQRTETVVLRTSKSCDKMSRATQEHGLLRTTVCLSRLDFIQLTPKAPLTPSPIFALGMTGVSW